MCQNIEKTDQSIMSKAITFLISPNVEERKQALNLIGHLLCSSEDSVIDCFIQTQGLQALYTILDESIKTPSGINSKERALWCLSNVTSGT